MQTINLVIFVLATMFDVTDIAANPYVERLDNKGLPLSLVQ
jgi:hypothetical protein